MAEAACGSNAPSKPCLVTTYRSPAPTVRDPPTIFINIKVGRLGPGANRPFDTN